MKKKIKIFFVFLILCGSIITLSFVSGRNSKANNEVFQDKIVKTKALKDGVLYEIIDPNEKIDQRIFKGEDPATNLVIKFDDYLLTIYDYGTEESIIDFSNPEKYRHEDSSENIQTVVNNYNDYYLSFPTAIDTITLHEATFHNLFNSAVRIQPINNKPSTRYEISIALENNIWESHKATNLHFEEDEDLDRWYEQEALRWDGTTRFYSIKDSANYYYRIPEFDNISEFDELKKTLNLRDTLVIIPGEYDDVSTIVYKERPCHINVKSGILKIEKYKGKDLENTQLIRIEFSYGC